MKFILNEHKKFILEEKFILNEAETLTEASAAEVAKQWAEKFKNTLDNTQKVLEKYISFAGLSSTKNTTKEIFTNTKNNINNAWTELEVSLSAPEKTSNKEKAAALLAMKAELKKYVEALKVVPTIIEDKKYKDIITLLNSKITDLEALDVKNSWEKSDIDDLSEISRWIEEKVLKLFDTSAIDSDSAEVEEFKKICAECTKLGIKIKLILPKDFTKFNNEDLKDYIALMKTADINTELPIPDNLNSGIVIMNLKKKYLPQVTTLQQNYEKILNSKVLSVSLGDKKERWNPTVDWAELYKECGSVKNRKEAYNAFWNGGLPLKGEENPLNLPNAANEKVKKGYYKGEWGAHGELVRSFGKNFTDTLFDSDYGWNETLNPFIALLKYLFKFDIITINDASFYHLVNAFKNRQITEKDLRGKGILGNINLIRNPRFYKLSTEMTEYLEWQKAAVDYKNSLPDNADFGTVFANIVANEGNTSKDAVFTDKTAATKINNSANYVIRDLASFKNSIKTYLKVDRVEKTTTKATDDSVNKIISNITDKNKAKKFISYWVNVYRVLQADWVEEISKTFKPSLIDIRNSTPTTFNEDREFDKLLSLKTTRYDKDQIKTILTKVVEIVNS